MQIDIITLFPNMFSGPFDESILRRAADKLLVTINIHNLRNWAIDKRGTVDDKPYGGGVGMILRPEPIFQAVGYCKKEVLQPTTYLSAEASAKADNLKPKIILLSASGKPYNQKMAYELSRLNNLILICGHYEGVDQRVADYLCDEEISIGDYVLTGGEIPAMVMVDSIVRLIPGVLEKKEATQYESFSIHSPSEESLRATSEVLAKPDSSEVKLLEYPHYTRPEDFRGYRVPEILLSGNHKEIMKWQSEKALERTKKMRPDLLKSKIQSSNIKSSSND